MKLNHVKLKLEEKLDDVPESETVKYKGGTNNITSSIKELRSLLFLGKLQKFGSLPPLKVF